MLDIDLSRVAHIVDLATAETIDVLGPTVQFLTPPEEDPCVMRGMLPPDAIVPLHSHPDPETFVVLSGELEGLAHAADRFTWVRIRAGDVFHVPGGTKHAFRNRSDAPAVMILVSTSKIGRFFREIATSIVPGAPDGPPSGETLRHFLETAKRYGYWNATPEENAEAGLSLPRT